MKKIIALMLLTVVLSFLLVGCQNNINNDNNMQETLTTNTANSNTEEATIDEGFADLNEIDNLSKEFNDDFGLNELESLNFG